ncbi:hypothetical protein M3J09_005377 [Ascochyta lentis]
MSVQFHVTDSLSLCFREEECLQEVEMPSDTRQHILSQARTSRSGNQSDKINSNSFNKLHPIGLWPPIHRQTHTLLAVLRWLGVPHGTSTRQLSPHFKSNKTPHRGTAWLDGSTRLRSNVPFLLTSLS